MLCGNDSLIPSDILAIFLCNGATESQSIHPIRSQGLKHSLLPTLTSSATMALQNCIRFIT